MADSIRRDLTDGDGRLAPERRFPLARPPVPRPLWVRIYRASLVRVAVYYVVLITVTAAAVRTFPIVRAALLSPTIPAVTEGTALLTGTAPPESWLGRPPFLVGAFETLLVLLAAIFLSLPVAWVYMLTKKLRFDPGLVRSVIILPIAVAGILLVVKNNLAVAFSLAGIVAAVRFRNTLKDPRDAVYIFLTITIGIAAGVQAIDVALIVSLIFNVVVVLLWRYQVGSIYGGRYGRTGVMSIGDTSLLVAQTPEAIRTIRRTMLDEAADMKTDGILLVHSTDPELARYSVQDALSQSTREWKLIGIWPRGDEVATAEYLVRLAREATPADLLGDLDDWATQIDAAEYIPFRSRAQPRDAADEGAKPRKMGGSKGGAERKPDRDQQGRDSEGALSDS